MITVMSKQIDPLDYSWLTSMSWQELAPWDRFDPYLCSDGKTIVDTWEMFTTGPPRLKEAEHDEGLARKNVLGIRGGSRRKAG